MAQQQLRVEIGDSIPVRLSKNASTFIVAQDGIALATPQPGSSREFVITGVGKGTTSVVALDADGRVFYSTTLVVGSREGLVTILGGKEVQSYYCSDVRCSHLEPKSGLPFPALPASRSKLLPD